MPYAMVAAPNAINAAPWSSLKAENNSFVIKTAPSVSIAAIAVKMLAVGPELNAAMTARHAAGVIKSQEAYRSSRASGFSPRIQVAAATTAAARLLARLVGYSRRLRYAAQYGQRSRFFGTAWHGSVSVNRNDALLPATLYPQGLPERDAVGEVRGSVDRGECPDPSGAGVVGSALFLAKEPDARRGLVQVIADGALDGDVDVGDQVPVGLLRDGDRGGLTATDELHDGDVRRNPRSQCGRSGWPS
jgi:hypothetical protein